MTGKTSYPTVSEIVRSKPTGGGPWAEAPLTAYCQHHCTNPAQEHEKIDVSVCIVNWNCRELLRSCLESLLARPQGVRLEVIVVDNGSEDGAADMVARDFPEAHLVQNPVNAGFSRANNQAAARARGRYLFFLNNDTIVPPHALERLRDFARVNPRVGIVGPRMRNERGKIQDSCRQRPTLAIFLAHTCFLRWTGLFRGAYRRYRQPLGRVDVSVGLEDATHPTARQPLARADIPQAVDVLMGAALFVPREIFFAAGGWDEDYYFGGEDMDLCYRIGRSFQVVYHPQIEITHLGRSSTRQIIGSTMAHILTGFARYLRKTGSKPRAVWTYKLLIALDAPLQGLVKGLQYLWRRLRGRRAKAEKTLVILRGLTYFLSKGLVPFWKA